MLGVQQYIIISMLELHSKIFVFGQNQENGELVS